MMRVLAFAGLGVGALLSLTSAASAQPAATPQAASGPNQPAVQLDTPGEIGLICLSNACMKDVSSPPRDAAAAARAIEAGDIEKLMMAGGTPEDVIAALRSRLRADPNAIFNPQSANQAPLSLWMSSTERHMNEGAIPQFIQNNGRTSLAFFSPSGHLDAVTTVPGMNGAGIAPRGAVYNVPPPPPPPPPPLPPAELLDLISAQ